MALPASADQAPDAPAGDAAIENVVVVAQAAGPALWTVRNGDHVLRVLGVAGPLLKDMPWHTHAVEAAVAQSAEVIGPVNMKVSADVGFFQSLTILPSLIGIRDNPGKAKLKDVLPPDLYARWSVLKAQYIGSDESMERWRPMFAASALYLSALRKNGFDDSAGSWSDGDPVWRVVKKAAQKNKVAIQTPMVRKSLDAPRAAIKEFKATYVNDADCFALTLDRVESGLDTLRARANAWALGDVEGFRRLPSVLSPQAACGGAFLNAQLAGEWGLQDLPGQVRSAWLDEATAALNTKAVSFAVAPMGELTEPDGLLDGHRQKGYAVTEPR